MGVHEVFKNLEGLRGTLAIGICPRPVGVVVSRGRNFLKKAGDHYSVANLWERNRKPKISLQLKGGLMQLVHNGPRLVSKSMLNDLGGSGALASWSMLQRVLLENSLHGCCPKCPIKSLIFTLVVEVASKLEKCPDDPRFMVC